MVCLQAHDLTQSESQITVQGRVVDMVLFVDLLGVPDVDADANGRVSYEELDRSIERVFSLIKGHLRVTSGTAPGSIVLQRHDIVADHVLRAGLRYEFVRPPEHIEVASTLEQLSRPDHVHLVTVTVGNRIQRAVLRVSAPSATFDVASAARASDVQRLAWVGAALAAIGLLVWWRLWAAESRTSP